MNGSEREMNFRRKAKILSSDLPTPTRNCRGRGVLAVVATSIRLILHANAFNGANSRNRVQVYRPSLEIAVFGFVTQ